MWKVSIRNLMARKVRLALSAFAIVLGVAFVAGSFIFSDALSGAFNGIVRGSTADVEVFPSGGAEVNSFGTDARTMPASLLDELSQLPEAKTVVGTAQVPGVYVIGADGKLVGGNGPPGLAMNFSDDVTSITGDPIAILADGKLPTHPGEVALDVDTAERAGYEIGDRVTIVTPGDPPTMTAELCGLVRFGAEGGLIGATITYFDKVTMQGLFFDGRDVYTTISMNTADGVSQEQLRDAVREVLPDGVEAQAGDEFAQTTQDAIEDILGFITTFLLVFAAVSMIVGTFLIINTFSILVAQRSRELALLRAMGASRRQIHASVVVEALILGIAGSTVGIVFGYLLAIGLKALFGVIGLDIGQASMPLMPRTIIVSYAVGIIVTVLAAYVPARRAARISPVEAMGDNVTLSQSSTRTRLLIGSSFAITGAALLALGLSDAVGHILPLIGAGMLAILVGVSLTSSIIGRPLMSALGAVYRRWFGTVGTLATENSMRNPRRTGATASALMVGLTLVTLMSILGQSAKASTDKAIEQTITADLIVSNATGQFFSPAYADEIRRVDGVEAVTAIRLATAKIDGSQVFVQATNPRSLGSATQLTMLSGTTGQLTDDSVLISSAMASGHDLSPGDTATLRFPAGPQQFVVAGVYPATGAAIVEDFLLTLGGLERSGIKPEDSVLYIAKEPGASEATVRAAIDAILADNPTVTLKDQQEYAQEQKELINTFLYLIYALLGLAIVIAILGITNTLALSVIERTREVGLLRAVGLARRRLRFMMQLESIAISILGAVLGIVLGTGFGVVLQHALADDGIDVLSIPWARLGLFVLLAAAVGMLAAVLPARRAAKLSILRAISSH